jgi:hypothetical protein
MSCKFFLKGKCVKGEECDHPHISKEEVCKNKKCVEKFHGFPNHTENQCTMPVDGIPIKEQTEARQAFFKLKMDEDMAEKAKIKAAMTPEELAAKAAEVAKAKAVQEAVLAMKAKMSPEELKDYMAEKAKIKAEKTAKFAAEKAAKAEEASKEKKPEMAMELWGDMPIPSAGGGAVRFEPAGKVVNGVAPRPPTRVQNAKPTYAMKVVPGMVEKQKADDKSIFIAAVQKKALRAEKVALLQHICSGVGQLIEQQKDFIQETIGELFEGFDFSKLTIEMVVNEVYLTSDSNELIKNVLTTQKSYEEFVLSKVHDAVTKAAAPV